MGVYLIGVGGSGAKCIEGVIQLAAVGLFTEEPIKVLFVDADETNGNLERSRNSLKTYQRCYELTAEGDKQECPWMKTKIESFDLWSPFAEQSLNKTIKTFFQYNTIKQNQPALGNLFDVLYTKEEQDAELDVGFRGRPAIGSAVMSQVDLNRLEQEPWGSFIKQIQADTGSGKIPKILLCGSIFGGTGASGLPTIARLIANKLNAVNVRARVQIGCLFLLPYFGFAAPPGEDPDGVYARSEQFLLNTEAALRYYLTQGKEIFDTVYLLGSQNLSRVNFSIGKNSQRNEPHFVELYGALAVRHFLFQPPSEPGTVVLVSRESIGRLTWNDLPDREQVKADLINAARFAFSWLSGIAPELEKAKTQGFGRFGNLAPWLTKFYSNGRGNLPDFNDPNQQNAIAIVSYWCKGFLWWLYYLHQAEGEVVELFNVKAWENLNGELKGEELPNLAIRDNRDRTRQSQDTPARLKNNLDPKRLKAPNQGTIGLARALYILCRL
ncbi:hypothetical protein [Merismopedia glauca]|uniref:Uncharacterized protein n=1 Tax=Merismopedia glauca CCAP 1448/3 TaxID=1296344 RepID=A0A2T1C7Y6_9CYAN|nr:hypothetical protein [Merismopedia glauca]PSB04278.1 hypothetical protein C7B64_04775 [Merismopedia glauca CCAP 1448/3]